MTSIEAVTVPQLLASNLVRLGDAPALGTIERGDLYWRTWREIGADVDRFSEGLRRAGVRPGDRVVQVSANRYEWIVMDLAVLSLGAVHVALHSSLSAAQLVRQIADSQGQVVVFSQDAEVDLQALLDPSLTVLAHNGAWMVDASVIRVESEARPEDLATLIYTSGTTGKPHGVMLSHQNLTSNAISVSEAVGTNADETRLCFLPLSHIYARTCDLYSWLYCGSRLVLAESRETIFRDCQTAQPTVINGVPYFYEKVAQQLRDAPSGALRSLLGGRIQRCFCGGAAMAPEVEVFFASEGLPILSGYGLTEASPVVTATAIEDYEPGTVGRPLAGVEVRLTEDHQVCVRGPNVMLGYWRDPNATKQAIVEGWLNTGDRGQWETSGHLRILGRQNEMIVLSTGKNVWPARVEQLLAGSPLIERACVVGEGRKCLGGLIVPNPDALRTLIREHGLWVWSRRRAVTHARVRKCFRVEIDRLLASVSREEQIGPFALLDRDFSLHRGEVTAKLSLRRTGIAESCASLIERLYR
ncbi:MAG: AMP-dependent synthetase/ligase [Pirellulales bacterium]|nr:AMP-dependent synthetase/ligase [Pirellulales bacterium]